MIILSIPYYNKDSLIDKLIGVDLIEYRLDYCPKIESVDLSRFKSTTILTYRHSNHKCTNIKGFYRRVVEDSSAYVDIDMADYYLCDKITNNRLIISLHLNNWDEESIEHLIKMSDKAKYLKLAVYIETWNEMQRLLDFLQRIPNKNQMIVSVMGKWSTFSRILYRFLPSKAVYVFDKEYTMEDQISLSDALTYRVKHINAKTLIYGIIGDYRVNYSLSLTHYNKIFYGHKVNAVYLPIPLESTNEIESVLSWLKGMFTVIGISITMPFKRQLPQYFGEHDRIANTWLLNKERFFNTDAFAMQQSLAFFSYKDIKTILVLGTGAMAYLTLSILTGKGLEAIYATDINDNEHSEYQIYLLGRDKDKESKLIKYFNIKEGVEKAQYDLLINCTSLIHQNDLIQFLSGISFYNLIDLPYSDQDSFLVTLAKKQHLPYIDGIAFWKWQFEAQNRIFLSQIINSEYSTDI